MQAFRQGIDNAQIYAIISVTDIMITDIIHDKS
jgi:hypothetical protein